jgi:MFS family permease
MASYCLPFYVDNQTLSGSILIHRADHALLDIGNAKIAGLTRDLNLSNSQYEWLLTAFYITYIVFEWMTLCYRLIPPHIYISLTVLCWGLVASLQSLTQSFTPLLLLRGVLGIAEAAFGPGVPFYLSFFYKRRELAFRTGLFISAAPLATAFAGSLAWLIMWAGEKLNVPVASWRLLFLVEGFPSVVVSVLAWDMVPDSPNSATFLSKREREVAGLRLRAEREGEEHRMAAEEGWTEKEETRKQEGGLRVRELLDTLKDPKAYLTAVSFY